MGRQTLFFCLMCLLWQGYSFPFDGKDSIDPMGYNLSNAYFYNSMKNDSVVRLTTEKTGFSTCRGLRNKTGHCEYMKKCLSDEYRSNFALAMNHTCIIDQTYVGICCSNLDEETKDTKVNFASVLPIIAENDGGSVDAKVLNTSRIVWREEEGQPKPRPQNWKDSNMNWERSRGCGTTSKSHGRIVGGRPADPTEWPWMVALLRKNEVQYCGGVLITDRHVLTAAHCVYKSNPRDIKVRLGEYDFSTREETRALDFAVTEIRVHPDFDYTSYENDIAILKMHRSTVFNSYIWPVCLPPIDQTFENVNAVVTGWGTRYYGGPASTVLMEVGVPIWPQQKCVRSFVQRIPKTAMCAGAYEGGRDACQGDSGGPLLHQLANGRWVNIGIVSWGIRCGERGRPGIYTRVSSYLDWIFANAVF